MSKKQKETDGLPVGYRPPALSPESKENQLISLAVSLAEKQLREGTASSQVITHFLKLGTVKEQVELEKTKAELELMKVKAESIRAGEEQNVMYKAAIDAMMLYQGRSGERDDEEDIF